jgi:signal transduction histidine kinase
VSAGAERDAALTRELYERIDDSEQLCEQAHPMADAADQAKSGFLATVSHELRTPLTALTGYSELLADEILGPLTPLQRDTIERMRAVMHHLTVMIDEILTFSSLKAGRERVLLTSVSPARVMRAAASVVEPLARKKGIEFLVQADDAVPPLQSDEDKIVQILVNLTGNAVKFTDIGKVQLTLTDLGDQVHFIVADTGIGIAKDDLTRLFQPFSQMDTSLTRRHGGNGLGLYISRRLAVLLGGRVEVESAPEVGSIFTLILPR